MNNEERFRDPKSLIYDFMDEYLVVCPQCAAGARVVPIDLQNSSLFAPRRLFCRHCGHTKDWQKKSLSFTDGYDSYFGLPLWLQIRVGDHMLWAYNHRHLELLDAFIQSPIRERRRDKQTGWRNSTLISRLPEWIKAAKKRKQLLKAIDKLKQRLDEYDVAEYHQ